MEVLTWIGTIASVLGVLVSAYTLWKVEHLPGAMKRQSRAAILKGYIDLLDQATARSTVSEEALEDIRREIKIIRNYDVSRIPMRHAKLKTNLSELTKELNGKKDNVNVRRWLRLVYDELTIR